MTATIDEEQSRGGSLTAAISNAVVRRTAQYTGRGPTRARTVIRDDTILVLLRDTLPKGEGALVAHGREEKVVQLRGEFQAAMREDLTADIEQLTGRKVIAFMSANHVDADLAAELFILEPQDAPQPDGLDVDGNGYAPTLGERGGRTRS